MAVFHAGEVRDHAAVMLCRASQINFVAAAVQG